jgi:hypothetical protein
MHDLPSGQTVRLDAPQGHPLEGFAQPVFWAFDPGGARVLFTDTRRLTEHAGASPGKPDLYQCDMTIEGGMLQCALSDLTPAGAGDEAAGVAGVLGTSSDGSWVYFAADAKLAAGADEHAECANAAPGATCNLYVRHAGTTSLVAVLSGADRPNWSTILARHPSRVSADGQWLAFMSQRSLTGYDNEDVASRAAGERLDEEVFLYHASTGGLLCASCNPTGGRPSGVEYRNTLERRGGNEAEWESTQLLAASIPVWVGYGSSTTGQAVHAPRSLSVSGRLFFNSNDALVPQDVNATGDVYQYEPPGEGNCASSSPTLGPRSGGCVSLISSGSSGQESAFLDASESGNDVFFLTAAKLSPQDTDSSYDIYDAHVCTSGSPCLTAAVTPPDCTTADACRAAPSPQPSIFGPPSSATFSGLGNPFPSPAPPLKARTAAQIRAEQLARALRACRTKNNHHRRAVCEAQARRRYRPIHAARSTRNPRGANSKRRSK